MSSDATRKGLLTRAGERRPGLVGVRVGDDFGEMDKWPAACTEGSEWARVIDGATGGDRPPERERGSVREYGDLFRV